MKDNSRSPPELKAADLIEDMDPLRMARREAFDMVRDDPNLEPPTTSNCAAN